MPLRIIGGRARGRRLRSPPGEGVRPTGDRVREALFNIWGGRLDGLRLLDVCAGSGAISLEALSRGADEAVAIERDPERCRHIGEEAERAGLTEGLRVIRAEALEELGRLRREGAGPFDLAFADPPWEEEALRREILALLFETPPLCRSAAAEAPEGKEEPAPPPGARLVKRSRYGRTVLLFFEALAVGSQGETEEEREESRE